MVSEARRLAARAFGSWGMDSGQVELACLLVSEVVTNAVLHASVTPSPGRDLDLDMEPLIMPAPVGAPVRPGRPGRRRKPGRPPPATPAWRGPRPSRRLPPPREFPLRLRRGATSVWVEVFDPRPQAPPDPHRRGD